MLKYYIRYTCKLRIRIRIRIRIRNRIRIIVTSFQYARCIY